MNYQTIKESLPTLITNLAKINPTTKYEARFIGQAIAYLELLSDMIEEKP